jgi:hypothetical protein
MGSQHEYARAVAARIEERRAAAGASPSPARVLSVLEVRAPRALEDLQPGERHALLAIFEREDAVRALLAIRSEPSSVCTSWTRRARRPRS